MRANEFIVEGTLSVDVPNEAWLQDKIDYAKSKGRNSYGVPYMGSTTAGVVGTPPRVRVMRLASLPGMRNEQMNVRKNDLKWLMDYMERTGKLPPMGSNPNEEYLPYIMVAYNGEAWVNEGNHRIMAAYRLNWQDMPIEIRYFDGGERIATGPMAPGKIGLGGVNENMSHSKDSRAVDELKAALTARKDRLKSASDDQVYDIIDKIMTRIAKTHSISGQKLHDMWVDKYHEVPDTWIMNENFADGKKPGRKGLAKRVGVNCKQPVSKLRGVAANSSGERQRMAHWCANMKAGRKK